MRSADRNAAAIAQQLGQHLTTMQQRNVAPLRGQILWVAPIDCRADDHGMRAIEVGGVVSDRYLGAFFAQARDEHGFFHVGARNALAARKQNPRDRAHADPADAHEMPGFCALLAYRGHMRFFRVVSASTRARIVVTGSIVRARSAAARRSAETTGLRHLGQNPA